MERAPDQTPASNLIRLGFRSLARPPFRTLWLVGLLIAVASPSLVQEADDLSLVATIVFALVTFLLEMTTILAAAETEPAPSGDLWIKTAVRRRTFWRFVVAALLADLIVGIGIVGLIVGGVLLAGIVVLAPQAAVLERKVPFHAVQRSIQLTRGGRGRIRLVYSVMVILPTLPSVALFIAGVEPPTGAQVALGAFNTTFTFAAFIALTRAFVELGGAATPEEEPAATVA